MKKVILKSLIGSVLLSSAILAQAEGASFDKYQQAKLAVQYKGGVGDFAQQIAYKLGVGYYAMQADPNLKIAISQDKSKTLSHLLDGINAQLPQQNIRFELLNDKVVLALTGDQVTDLVEKQFIGNVIFDAVEENITPKQENQIELESPSEPSSEVIDLPLQPQDEKAKLEQAKKIQDILSVSQDKKLIAQYGKRKQPIYAIEDKSKVKLDTIKSTKVSTFLVFDNGVNVEDYKIEGEFQDIAKLDNIIAILHRQKQPPEKITLTAPNGEQQVLEKSN